MSNDKDFESMVSGKYGVVTTPITIVLLDDDNNEELGRAQVESENDIVSYSISYDMSTDETIVYVFDSNVEIFRRDGNISKKEAESIIDDFASFYILKTKQEVYDFDNKIGDYENR